MTTVEDKTPSDDGRRPTGDTVDGDTVDLALEHGLVPEAGERSSADVRRRSVLDDVRQSPRIGLDFVADGSKVLFAGPVGRGRPRLDGRTAGMKAVAVVGVLAYLVAIGIVLFGGALRAGLRLAADADGSSTLSLPRSLLWIVIVLVVVSIALMQAGALHAPVWLRLMVLTVTVLAFGFIGTADFDPDGGVRPAMIVAFTASAVLVAFQLVRWRRSPQWWEFVVVLMLTTVVLVTAYAAARTKAVSFGVDSIPSFTTLSFYLLGQLAIPMTIVSGISAAEVGVSASTWSTGFVSRRLSFLVVGGLTLTFCVIRLRDSARGALVDSNGDSGAWHQLVGALILVGLIALLWLALDAVADRRGADSSRIDHIVGDVQGAALPVAVLLSITNIPVIMTTLGAQVLLSIDRDNGVGTRLRSWSDSLTDDTVVLGSRVAGGILLVLLAFWLAHRGRRGPSELTGVIGLMLVWSYATDRNAVFEAVGGWSRAIDAVGVAAIVAVLVWRLTRRTLTVELLGALLLLLMLTVLLSKRDYVSNPLNWVLGFAGVGFILFGYVWNFITGAEVVNRDSGRFPRDARLLLFLAFNVFGLTVLAWAALVRSVEFGTNLGPFASLGDQTIGIPLIVAAFAGLFAAVARGDHG